MNKSLKKLAFASSALILTFALATPVGADPKENWVNRWNQKSDSSFRIKAEDTLFKASTSEQFPGLFVAGFRQSDQNYTLGKVIWKGQDYSPLAGLAAVLKDLGFSEMSDDERHATFLALLQETYGAVGLRPYTGEPSKKEDRPVPIQGSRSVDNSHKFQVWLYKFPLASEEGEWRKILFFVAPDGSRVQTKTLGTHSPKAERLRDFPEPLTEFFE